MLEQELDPVGLDNLLESLYHPNFVTWIETEWITYEEPMWQLYEYCNNYYIGEGLRGVQAYLDSLYEVYRRRDEGQR